MLEEVCQLSEEERKRIGKRGKNYVINEKNAKKQTQKIVDMIRSVVED